MARAWRDVQHLVLREAPRAEQAAIDRMIRIAADRDRAAVADADEHAATDRAVAAGRRHPALGNPARRRVADDRIVGVRITIRPGVETDEPLERRQRSLHAASCARYGAARCRGTALTKNRYRPTSSATSVRGTASQCAAVALASGRAMAPSASRQPRAMSGA